ncbi:integrase core domain-containing protein [Xanthocytophaga flavus]|uniref:integrase core domain-containing protein n=1 Tax=Xanthocytophaga flava TaxID=3048013 RepID=UPI00391F3CA9
MERLWRTVKYEYLYLNPPEDGWQLYQGLSEFFKRYNYQKHHQGIGRSTPASRFYSIKVESVFN